MHTIKKSLIKLCIKLQTYLKISLYYYHLNFSLTSPIFNVKSLTYILNFDLILIVTIQTMDRKEDFFCRIYLRKKIVYHSTKCSCLIVLHGLYELVLKCVSNIYPNKVREGVRVRMVDIGEMKKKSSAILVWQTWPNVLGIKRDLNNEIEEHGQTCHWPSNLKSI
ncbi:hypothetical protein BpHYR1_001267 [Brachionus plicatilis]|uniref:Uncharacterized protein n=1 Tax=Brachionus plicatilis TaxID=10195 RepID=A0A3M7RB88_BRAPC|nr:hypothetical protein BpHYR1_001267 [Brachionus plicatilis]